MEPRAPYGILNEPRSEPRARWNEAIRSAVNEPFFESEFPSSMEAMAEPLEGALSALRERGWVKENSAFYAHLCLEEALVNAIIHGNESDVSRKVRLALSEEGPHCVIRVWDEGRGFCVDQIKMPDVETQGGRGVCLIKYCMDEVEYNKTDRCLVMKLPRNGKCTGYPGARE